MLNQNTEKENLTMKMLRLICFSTIILLLTTTAYAIEPPKIVTEAFDAYAKEGFDKAFSIWMKGSALENDTTSLMAMKGGFTQIETAYGKMIGHEIIKVYQITKFNIRTFAVILYEKGPLYLYVDCYNYGDNWIIPELQFHTKAQMILPNELLYKE